MIAPEQKKGRFPPEFVATLLVLAAYVIWMLWVPLWPSQDGPVHLYYAQVFGKLLHHSDPGLEQYFRVKHLLPPYALYYYALIGLSSFVSPFLADRLIICCYLISFVFGFRFVASCLGPSRESSTLLATVLLLNWPLGMGFVNYCLALSFALWGVGLWLRFGGRNDVWLRVGFVVLAFVVLLTHPVPLLLMLGLCIVLLLADMATSRWGGSSASQRRQWRRDVPTLLFAGLTLVYIRLFTKPHPLQAVLPETGSFVSRVIAQATRFAKEDGMAVLFGSFLSIRIDRLALLILLVVCVAIGTRQTILSWRRRSWSPGDTIFVLGLLLLIVMPFVPPDLNGLFYFADRLPLLVWLTLLLAASRSTMLSRLIGQSSHKISRRMRIGVMAFAIMANVAVLVGISIVIWPIAREIATVNRAPLSVAHEVGFIIEDPREPKGSANVPSWNPYYWAAIHVVRRNDAILANAPWMDETILPVGPGPALPEQYIPVLQTPVPNHLYGELLRATAQRIRAMDAVNFIVVQQHNQSAPGVSEDLMTRIESGLNDHWICQDGMAEWYRLCRRK